MSLSSVEEERLQGLKRWWDQFGVALTALIVLAAVGVGGYFGWTYLEEQELAAAGQVYSQALGARQAGETEAFEAAYQQLRAEHAGTPYAVDAALLYARDRYQTEAPDEALGALRWAVDHAREPARETVARVRLARLYLDQDDPDQALSVLEDMDDRGFTAAAAEVRGDAWLALDEQDRARAAYREALGAMDRGAMGYELVEMKLLDLGGEAP